MTLPVSVIVLTKNSEPTLGKCLDAVSRSGAREIVVVDGGSRDRTLDIARQYTDNIYFDEGRGLCYARQLGAEMATSEYVMYVDSDVILLPGTLEALLAELRAKGYGSVTARVLMTGARGYQGWALARYKNVINPDRPRETKSVPMRATIFPRELVLQHQFDLSMPNSDGSSIGFRLVQAGYTHAISSAAVHHYCPPERNGRSVYWEGVAIGEFFLKHRRSPKLVLRYTLLGGLLFPIYRAVLCVARGDPRPVPYFLYVFVVELAGFISTVFRVGLGFFRALPKRAEP